MWKHVLMLLTSFLLLYSSSAYTQTDVFYNPFHVWNSGGKYNSIFTDNKMILDATAIKEKGFADFALYKKKPNSIVESLKEKQNIPGKKKGAFNIGIEDFELDLQAEMNEIIREVYEQANKLNIEMPPYPDPPFTDNHIEYFMNYYQQKFVAKIFETIEYLENEKKRKKEEEEKNSREIKNIIFDLTDKIYYSVESDDPIQALKDLEEDFYYKRNMEYLKEVNNEQYRLVLREYIHVLRLMKEKKPVITLITTENDFETSCYNSCTNNK